MSEKKDTSVIPKGPYCYSPDEEKNANKDENDPAYYIKTCPYFSYEEDEGVTVVVCKFLNEGGLIDGTEKKEFKKLKKKYGSKEAVWDKYPLDLLWDQVKECGENKEW